ncbi:MAG: hypothetical protein H9897_00510 [Candidatus Ureaplasma intestinipullorum]|uniref:PTS EIIB type-1 domain-containing protein n=1 Tax=Candidatus Ureaplasma intestinipullorum TaxID=2838770 RepID=A0A9E2KVW3_9BACT|nr:hypothetical protein [Candidatus Ureaplasma intestinipullorum]
MKQSTKIKLFYIFTFGIGYLLAKKKAKNVVNMTNDQILTSKKIDFNISDLVSALGQSQNIVEINSTISNLKVKVKDIKLVNVDEIKKLGALGTLINIDVITILFGDNSEYVAELLKKSCKLS